MEFDFTVKYRKGAANTVADCVSRLPTFHESSWTPDLDIPCYLVAQDPESLLKLETFNVSEDQPRTEKRKAELRNDLDLEDFEESSRVLAAEPEAELSPITPEELLRAQSVDPTCIDIRSRLEEGVSLPYRTNSQGLLTRLSPWDDREQIFVPPPLRAKALALAHYPAATGHPGSTRMYQSLRREFYWPNMALDTHECVRNCVSQTGSGCHIHSVDVVDVRIENVNAASTFFGIVDAAPTFSGCPDVHFFTKFLSKKWMRQSTVVDAASTEWTSVILDVPF